jgi:hypothetical protein
MGTGSFPGVKRPGRGVDHPPQYSAEVKERVERYLYFTSVPPWPVIEWFTLRTTEFPLNCVYGSFGAVTAGVRFQTLGNFVHLVQKGCSAQPVDTGLPFLERVQRPMPEADRSHQFIAKVKNAWIIPVLPPYIFMAWYLITQCKSDP